jgi:two-component system sensor histidine kinase RegB
MTMIIDELMLRPEQDESLHHDLTLLKGQVDSCKQKIQQLLESAGYSRSEGAKATALRRFVVQTLDGWQVIRPEIEFNVIYVEPFDNPVILAEQTIAQSLINLLNNAADASIENDSRKIHILVNSRDQTFVMQIDDEGKGITPEQTQRAGVVSFSTKASGLGIGLILSNASLGRFGGEVALETRPEGGTRTLISLPLKELIIEDMDKPHESDLDS